METQVRKKIIKTIINDFQLSKLETFLWEPTSRANDVMYGETVGDRYLVKGFCVCG